MKHALVIRTTGHDQLARALSARSLEYFFPHQVYAVARRKATQSAAMQLFERHKSETPYRVYTTGRVKVIVFDDFGRYFSGVRCAKTHIATGHSASIRHYRNGHIGMFRIRFETKAAQERLNTSRFKQLLCRRTAVVAKLR